MTNLAKRLEAIGPGGSALSSDGAAILERHCIEDLPAPSGNFRCIRVVLLVESPYRREVSICHMHPLAGSSGKKVTRIFAHHDLIDAQLEDPIGCLVKNGMIPWLAIMNVSQLPLDKAAYNDSNALYSDQIQGLFELFGKIKKSAEQSGRNVNRIRQDSNVRDAIIRDFTRRIRRLDRLVGLCRHRVLLVPCGWVARNFLDTVALTEAEIYDHNVFHPKLWTTDGDMFVRLVRKIEHYKGMCSL